MQSNFPDNELSENIDNKRRQLLALSSAFAGIAALGFSTSAATAEVKKPPVPRRIVTGRDDSGKSVFKSVDVTPRVITFESRPDAAFYELYATSGVPQLTGKEPDPMLTNKGGFPQPGETLFRIVQFVPQAAKRDPKVFEKFLEEFSEKIPGMASHFERDNPGMHTSDTLDYGIVIYGEMILELDDGQKVHLYPGDCVVQNGTRHRWINPLSEPSLVAFILIGGKREAS
ncbi:MAG: hypothetical protein RL637_1147 [Pseudomonadota bacterium]|jgi:mannose-6-phosphate isomerase-like protein (cupin superfamily)